jgi:hypothetical protein
MREPQRVTEKEALDYAVHLVDSWRERLRPDTPDRFFIIEGYRAFKRHDPEAGRRYLTQEVMNANQQVTEDVKQIVLEALREGEPLTQAALWFIEACLLYPGKRVRLVEMPDGSVQVVPDNSKRAKGRKRDTMRDTTILVLIDEVSEKWGFTPTRSTGGEPSAASIVKRALEAVGVYLEEKSIEKIWNNRNKI